MKTLKKILCMILAVVMAVGVLVLPAQAADFTDADEITHDEAVAVLSGLGIVNGVGDGSFNPKGSFTRAQAAALLANVVLTPEYAAILDGTKAPFSDVPAGSGYAKYINWAVEEGYISGYPDGTYKPSKELTGLELAALMIQVLGQELDASNYKNFVIQQTRALGLADGITGYVAGNVITRDDAVQMMFNAMTTSTSGEKMWGVYKVNDDGSTSATPYETFSSLVDAAVTADYLTTDTETYTVGPATSTGTILNDTYKVVASNAPDSWGRPQNGWVKVAANGKKTAIYTAKTSEPVLEYTTAVTAKKIYSDLELTDSASANVVCQGETTPIILKLTGKADVLDVTGNGCKTEVYDDGDGTYTIVVIPEVYVTAGKVTTTTNSDTGKKTVSQSFGHTGKTTAFDGPFSSTKFVNYTKGTALVMTYGKDGEVLSLTEPDVVSGKISRITTKGSVKTYTIDGEAYQMAADCKANLDLSAGSEVSLYVDEHGYILDVVTEENQAAAANYIKVLAASDPTAPADDWMVEATGNKVYTGEVYGILSTGEYGRFTVNYGAKASAEAAKTDKAKKDAVYAYTYNDDGELVLSSNITAVASTAKITSGKASVSYAGGTGILNSSTVYYFYKVDSKTGAISSFTTKVGNSSSGVIDEGATLVIEKNVVKFVFVGSDYAEGVTSVAKAYIDHTDFDVVTVNNGDGKGDITTYTYTGITSDGEEIELTTRSALTETKLYAYNSDMTIDTTTVVTANTGKITVYGSVIAIGDSAYNYDADHVAFVGDAADEVELATGQTVIYVLNSSKSTITEMWVITPAPEAED